VSDVFGIVRFTGIGIGENGRIIVANPFALP
jgi:hypothetical protein